MNQQLSILTPECQSVYCMCIYLCVCVCMFLLGEMSTQHLLTHRLLRQSKPELTGFQGNIFILVLSPLQHVLRWNKEKENLTKQNFFNSKSTNDTKHKYNACPQGVIRSVSLKNKSSDILFLPLLTHDTHPIKPKGRIISKNRWALQFLANFSHSGTSWELSSAADLAPSCLWDWLFIINEGTWHLVQMCGSLMRF